MSADTYVDVSDGDELYGVARRYASGPPLLALLCFTIERVRPKTLLLRLADDSLVSVKRVAVGGNEIGPPAARTQSYDTPSRLYRTRAQAIDSYVRTLVEHERRLREQLDTNAELQVEIARMRREG